MFAKIWWDLIGQKSSFEYNATSCSNLETACSRFVGTSKRKLTKVSYANILKLGHG